MSLRVSVVAREQPATVKVYLSVNGVGVLTTVIGAVHQAQWKGETKYAMGCRRTIGSSVPAREVE